MFERFDPPLIPNPGPADLAAAKGRWAARRRRIVMAASGTTVVVVALVAALLAPSFGLGDKDQHVASNGGATTTTSTQPAPPPTEAPTTSTTVRRAPTTTVAPPPTTQHPVTRVETFSPWVGGRLAPGVAVNDNISGTNCDMQSSFETGSPFAWRCNEPGGAFRDPCFAPPNQSNVTQVACTYSPWSTVTLMTLSQPLANSSWGTAKASPVYPWAMELANGEQCGLIEGTGTQVGRTMFNYGCGPGYGTSVNTKTVPWTIFYSPNETGPITSVAVKTAWT